MFILAIFTQNATHAVKKKNEEKNFLPDLALVIAHQKASVTVTIVRVPLIPASKKVAVTYPLSVDDETVCTCWLGRVSMQAVMVFITASGVTVGRVRVDGISAGLQDTPATPM